MHNYIISTDATADLSQAYAKEKGIVLQALNFSFGDELYRNFSDIGEKDFYDRLRNGAVSKTNATIPGDIRDSFEKILKEGKDIFHISFSSALSASYSVARMMADELLLEYPERKIRIVDSLCAAPGQGLLVWYAVRNMENGMTIDENAKEIEKLKLHVCHEFTVEDLKYLARGGRISKTTALFGNIINLKPVLHVDNAGRLVSVGKVRGRKQSLNALVDNMASHLSDGFENPIVFIGHGDCPEDAEYVAGKVKERFGIDNIESVYLGAVIGSHSGPGTVALFYIGNSRE